MVKITRGNLNEISIILPEKMEVKQTLCFIGYHTEIIYLPYFLPKKGKKNLLVICPGFSSDCVETLEEILIQGKESFLESGGENFDLIPCLNDNDDHINLINNLETGIHVSCKTFNRYFTIISRHITIISRYFFLDLE